MSAAVDLIIMVVLTVHASKLIVGIDQPEVNKAKAHCRPAHLVLFGQRENLLFTQYRFAIEFSKLRYISPEKRLRH